MESLVSQLYCKIYKFFSSYYERKHYSVVFLLSSSSSSSLEKHPLRSNTSRTGAEGLSFYYPRMLHCLNQMLAVVLLSQHRVSSSKTVRPRAPCGARCIGHAVSTWSAVCSEMPRSQFGEGERPHLCIDEWNRPTPVRRRLSLTQAARGKPNPTGLAPVRGTKALRHQTGAQYSAVEWIRDKVAMRGVLAPASHREPTSRFSSVMREDSILRNATRW